MTAVFCIGVQYGSPPPVKHLTFLSRVFIFIEFILELIAVERLVYEERFL